MPGVDARDPGDVFDILSSSRRRMILHLLHEGDPEDVGDIGGLGRRIAAAENQTPIEAVTGEEYKRVYVSLYQTHLPTLHSAGFITYNKQSGGVEPEPWTERVLPLIEDLQELDATREPNQSDNEGAGRAWLRDILRFSAAGGDA